MEREKVREGERGRDVERESDGGGERGGRYVDRDGDNDRYI